MGTLAEYTRDALRFFQDNGARGTPVTLRDGTPGILIRTRGGPGGYFTPSGRIVTFWY
jgi:hypothetical protein